MDFVQGPLGVRLRPAQRVLASVAYDGVEPSELDEADRVIAAELFGPIDDIPVAARRVFALVKGARCGGSYIFGGLYSVWRALTADLSRLAPGERATALIVAPDLKLGRQTLRYALGALEAHPEVAPWIPSKTQDSFVVRRPDWHQVTVEVLPATRGGSAVRGRWLVSAVLDECAFFRDPSAIINDLDLFRAVVPRILPGGMVVLPSTPWLEQGLLFDEFSRNFGAPSTSVAALAPTVLMLDTDEAREMVATETERDPENAVREFGGEFITGGGGLFYGPELLKPALKPELALAAMPPPGVLCAIGGDLGLVRDASAFVAVHREGNRIKPAESLELRPKRGQPLKLSEVVAAGCAFAARHGQRAIWVDHQYLEPAREHLPKGFDLIPVPGGQEALADRHVQLRKAFRESIVDVPGPMKRLLSQLSLVVGKPVAGGNTQIVLPRRAGTHMDLAAAFVNGAWAVRFASFSGGQEPPKVRKRAMATTGGF